MADEVEETETERFPPYLSVLRHGENPDVERHIVEESHGADSAWRACGGQIWGNHR